jgi:hypothetical protein
MTAKTKFGEHDYKVGDILVVYAPTIRGRMIANLTYRGTGMWSHVGMVIAESSAIQVIEAIDRGVVVTELNQFLAKQKNLCIMRCNKPFDAFRLALDASEFIGEKYAWAQLGWDLYALMIKRNLGRAGIKLLKNGDSNGYTCPEVPAKCFAHQGIHVQCDKTDGVEIPSQFLAPNDYIDSFQFDQIFCSGMK